MRTCSLISVTSDLQKGGKESKNNVQIPFTQVPYSLRVYYISFPLYFSEIQIQRKDESALRYFVFLILQKVLPRIRTTLAGTFLSQRLSIPFPSFPHPLPLPIMLNRKKGLPADAVETESLSRRSVFSGEWASAHCARNKTPGKIPSCQQAQPPSGGTGKSMCLSSAQVVGSSPAPRPSGALVPFVSS